MVFPHIFAGSRWLQRDQLILIKGRAADHNEELPKVLVDKLLPLAAAQALYLRLTASTQIDIREIQAEIAHYPGDSPVFVLFAHDRRLQRWDRRYNDR